MQPMGAALKANYDSNPIGEVQLPTLNLAVILNQLKRIFSLVATSSFNPKNIMRIQL